MHSTIPTSSFQRAHLISLAGLLLIVLGFLGLYEHVSMRADRPSDFTQDYVAAQALRVGQSIYIDFAATPIRADDYPGMLLFDLPFTAPPGTIENFHPPFDALLFVPFSFLPYPDAFIIWSLLSILLYLAIIALVLYELHRDLFLPWFVVIAGLALFWEPFRFHMHYGQFTIPMVLCTTGCWALLRHDRPLLAGLLLGLACLMKLIPALIAACLLLIGLRNLLQARRVSGATARLWRDWLAANVMASRHWRAAAATAGTFVAGSLLTILVVGTADTARYSQEIVPRNVELYGNHTANFSITGVISRLLVPGMWKVDPMVVAPQVASPLILLANLLVLALFVYAIWHLPPTVAGDDAAFALASITLLLLSPLTWDHSIIFVLLPFAVLLQHIRAGKGQGMAMWMLAGLILVSLPAYQIMQVLYSTYIGGAHCLV